MGIIEDFYFGHICPAVKKYNPNSKCSQATARCEEIYIKLKKELPENKAKLVSEMYDCAIDMSLENGKENFVTGFVLGMRFGAECFCHKED